MNLCSIGEFMKSWSKLTVCIIYLVRNINARYLKLTQNFGIGITNTVEEASKLDNKNINTLFYDAISEYMKKFRVAFNILPLGKSVPPGHQ